MPERENSMHGHTKRSNVQLTRHSLQPCSCVRVNIVYARQASAWREARERGCVRRLACFFRRRVRKQLCNFPFPSGWGTEKPGHDVRASGLGGALRGRSSRRRGRAGQRSRQTHLLFLFRSTPRNIFSVGITGPNMLASFRLSFSCASHQTAARNVRT